MTTVDLNQHSGGVISPQDSGPKSLSIVVPVLNEEESIPHFLNKIEPIGRQLLQDHSQLTSVEIVFVDDGSTDKTVETILGYKPTCVQVSVVKLSRNFRKDNALAAGLAHAIGDAVVPMDVDLQDPPELLMPMVKEWFKGALIVNARRASRSSEGFLKRITSKYFYAIFNKLSDYDVQPNVGDFRLIDRKVVDVINVMPERVRFMKGIFSWVGFNPVTIDYERPERAVGQTKWNYWKLWNFAIDGITASSTLPIRIWTYFGLALSLFSFLYAFFLGFRTLYYGIDVPGYASIMIVVLVIGAFNFLALGLIGEYLGRLTIEARGRPIYVVEDVMVNQPDD